MFLNLCLIFLFSILGEFLLEKIRIPKIVWYLSLGILLVTLVLNLIDESLLIVSSSLRQIALVIILTRSGFKH